MMYFANPTGDTAVHDLMLSGALGCIDTPGQGRYTQLRGKVRWCADNGCFSERFNERRWWRWLEENAADAGTCEFAVAPDVLPHAAATLERSLPWLPKIRALGYPAAFVAQDGIENTVIPWDEFDCLFIGGDLDDVFKLGPIARQLVGEAKRRGKHVHMGRCNSLKRFRYATAIGCDSADGTLLAIAPKNLSRIVNWYRDRDDNPPLFSLMEGA